MRILHTADWHLGHTLRDHSREAEHANFLGWLVRAVVERKVDALLIAGDVFETSNPPPAAWRMWFQFLGDLKQARPSVQVVVIAGNHDSAARLEAPRDLLAAFDVRVIGSVARDANGRLLTANLLVPLRDAGGRIAMVCAAIPFLRSSDVLSLVPVRSQPRITAGEGAGGSVGDVILPRPGGPPRGDQPGVLVDQRGGQPSPHPGEQAVDQKGARLVPAGAPDLTDDLTADPLIDGLRALHDELFAAARRLREPGQALVAMAHGYLVGGALSELSERKVFGGNQHALPLDLFPADCAYVALGHLHRPQVLAGREHVRYSGSPIPLSMPEREHPHHVVFADFDGEHLQKVWSLRVPRLVPLVRIPERGELEPDAALAAVAALPPRDAAMPEALRPLVEVVVRLPQPSPNLGERIARSMADRNARLVRVEVVLTGSDAVGEVPGRPAELASLSPEEVFVRRYRRDHEGVPSPVLLSAFRELLDDVQHGGPA